MDDKLIETGYVPSLDTLDALFGDIDSVVENQEVGDGIVSKLGKDGEVIGIEIVSLSKTSKEDLIGLPMEAKNELLEAIRKQAAAGARFIDVRA